MVKIYDIAYRDPCANIDWEDINRAEIDCYMWEDNGYRPKAYASAYHTQDSLHVMLTAYEKEIKVVYEHMNDPVYKDSCLEFFIQPDPGRDHRYLNFEFNSKGMLLLGLGYDRHDRVILDAGNFKQFSIKASVEPIDDIKKWSVEFKIPFAFLKQLFPGFNPGAPGNMKGNFYKCGDDADYPHYGCWSRMDPDVMDFHLSRCFGTLVLENK